MYDGQRVPSGTVLYKQISPSVMPGWNVKWQGGVYSSLVAACHGRVMMTTELMDPKMDEPKVQLTLPADAKPDEKFFRQYVHIIPDRQHQIFKLVDQI